MDVLRPHVERGSPSPLCIEFENGTCFIVDLGTVCRITTTEGCEGLGGEWGISDDACVFGNVTVQICATLVDVSGLGTDPAMAYPLVWFSRVWGSCGRRKGWTAVLPAFGFGDPTPYLPGNRPENSSLKPTPMGTAVRRGLDLGCLPPIPGREGKGIGVRIGT